MKVEIFAIFIQENSLFENAKKQNITITKEYINYIEKWAEKTLLLPPRIALYIGKYKNSKSFKKYASEKEIYPYSIDEGFIDLSSSIDFFSM